MPICSLEWCGRERYNIGNGYCQLHYDRDLRGNVPLDAPIGRSKYAEGQTCSVGWCPKPVRVNGYCVGHNSRAKNGVDMDKPFRVLVKRGPVCTAPGCKLPHKQSGYCAAHGERVKKYGDPRVHIPIGTVVVDYGVPVGVDQAHNRVRLLWGKARQYPCVECGKQARDWAYDGTDPTQLYGPKCGIYTHYSRYPEYYLPLCASCHGKRDGAARARELREYRTLKHESGLGFEEIALKLGVKDGLDV